MQPIVAKYVVRTKPTPVTGKKVPEDSTVSASGSWREARTKAILQAALEELAQVGYTSFSIESVAARVGITKTTVYRRYPTKHDLVRSALQLFLSDALGEPPDTGSLRGDLIALGRQWLHLVSSILGQSMFRTRLLDRVAPELDKIGQDFEAQRSASNRKIAARAIARGELLNEADFEQLEQVLFGALMFKVILMKRAVDELEIARVADLLLNGTLKATTQSSLRQI